MEKNRPHVFFSNQLERLVDCLQKELFSKGAAFERRLVIVPDGRMKTYLYHRLAMHSEAKAAFGMEVMSLSEGLQELTRCQKKIAPFYFPSHQDLSFCLEQLISFLHLNRVPLAHMEPLWKYLGEKSPDIGGLLRRKIISLAEQIAKFFTTLGLQEDKVIAEWLDRTGWQQDLWRQLFCMQSPWSYPQQALQNIEPSTPKVHLFGFSYLPKVYFDFFQKTQAYTYLLSPSEYFWEDLYSDKERVFLQKVLEGKKVRLKVREQLDLYLKESNPLLGNWGKMGKEFLQRLGQIEPYIEEYYQPVARDSLLGCIQDDFLHLAEDGASAYSSQGDTSLQMHACTSKLREVEVLHETILQLLSKAKEGTTILPSDICVFSPTLNEYIPYIHQVFELCPIDYRIIDGVEKNKDDHVAALEQLLSLFDKRFSLASVLELFSFTHFQKKQGWRQEDVYLLTKWFEKAGIQWGYDIEHRRSILAKSVQQVEEVRFPGTWQHGFERLMSGLVMAVSEDMDAQDLNFAWPQYILEWSESVLLGSAISVITDIYHDLQSLDSKSYSFADWAVSLDAISAKYLQKDEENTFSLECQKLKKWLGYTQAAPFSLDSFRRLFKALCRKRKSSFQGSHLESITFSPLQAGAVVPSKVLYLLGMEEESFPRKEPSLSFCDLSALQNKSYLPTKAEEDRYLFLEALLSAREHFIVSYCRVSAKDQKPQAAAAVVEELFNYVKDSYPANHPSLLISHPAFSFNESYFSSQSAISSLSTTTQKAAKSYYCKQKKPLPPFFPEFYGQIAQERKIPEAETVSIKELSRFAKHPIKFFLQDVLEIYLPSLFQEEQGEFVLPAYEKASLRSDILKRSFDKVVKISTSKGLLPSGLFYDVAKKKIYEETIQIEQQLKEWGLAKGDIFTVSLSDQRKTAALHSSGWSLPAVNIKSPLGTHFRIEGVLSDVTNKGLLFHGEDKIKDLIQVWPMYLIFLLIADQIECASTGLYLTKKPQELFFDIHEPQLLLGQYLDYFVLCRSHASLLMPAWAEGILENDEKEFEKKMQAKAFIETSPFPDDYLRWVFLRDPPPSLLGLHAQQQNVSRDLFAPLLNRGVS